MGGSVDDVPATGLPAHVADQPIETAAIATEPPRPAPVDPNRSPNEAVCPYLRVLEANDGLGPPIESPHPLNRCAALADAAPQSFRQQELVCLTSGHVNCPRYLRATAVTTVATEPVRTMAVSGNRTLTPAIAAALVVLALAFMVSLGFVIANDGLILSAAARPPGSGGVLGEISSGAPSSVPSPTPSPTPTATPSPSPTSTPSPTPTASPTPTPVPTPTPKATPRSGRYALLKPCPDAPNCYLYVVRRGDNLSSISVYFGVPLDTIRAMNPWTRSGLQPGRALRLPPPTR
jgi:hypothetical protein